MAEHIKANPAVTITMIDGKPAPMNMPVDDIITSAEESGLVVVETEGPAVSEPSTTE